jgi:molybdenum ABC transporter molybdate-binding protein
MSTDDQTWARDWTVGLRVWVERQGRAILGEGRLELLEWIDRCHSISAAARQMGMSYRHAWVLVQEVNAAAGQALVEAATGGKHGGGARLTELGKRSVELVRALQGNLRQTAAGMLPRLLPGPAPARLHVAAAASLEDVLGQLLIDYALRQPAVQVRLISGASDALADQIQAGAGSDLYLSADPAQTERLVRLGLVDPESVVELAENMLAAIGASERQLPIRKAADLLGAEVQHIALALPSCPLGSYTKSYLEGLELYEEVSRRALWADHSRAVVGAVQAGRADVGLVYSSAAATALGCKFFFRAGRLPSPIRYVGAALRRSAHGAAAREFLKFLASPTATRRFRQAGFLPARRSRSRPT